MNGKTLFVILGLLCPMGILAGILSNGPAKQGSFSQPPLQPVLNADPSQDSNTQEQGEEREPLFVGWEKPQVALFVSGRQHGYIEPCGCIELVNQKGGMMRRHTLQKQLLDKGWTVLGLDAGNQVRRFGIQANIKLATTYECLCQTMGYQGIAFGPDDLRIPVIDLLQIMGNYGGENTPFLSANVTIFDPEFTKRFRVIEQGGRKIGVTAILGDEHIEKLPVTEDLVTQQVDESLGQVVPQLRAENCDFLVLISHTSLQKSRELAKAFPVFDLMITTGGSGDPTMLPEEIHSPEHSHTTQMIQVGVKGMHVGVVGLFADQQNPIRYQRVPLDARFEDSAEIKEKFLSYQNQLKSLGLAGLELKPIGHPTGRQFVGSEACYDCHDTAYDIWKDGIDGPDGEVGPHWRATLDLTDPGERTWVQRHHDPECLSCHVTGWNPQKYFPYQSGYLELGNTLLHGNGCENCHGPGSRHVGIENGEIDATEEEQKEAIKEMVLTLEEAKKDKCMQCHDLDNSPPFHLEGAFEEYWEKIKHYEDQ